MNDLLLELVPLGLSGAIIPGALLQVTMRLISERPLANTLSFVLGFSVFRAVLGIVAVTFAPSLLAPSGEPTALSHAVEIALGALLLWLGYRAFREPPEARGLLVKVLDKARASTPGQSFFKGLEPAAFNSPSLTIFLAGVAEIVSARPALVLGQGLGALLVFLLAMDLPMLGLVASYVAAPGWTARTVQAFSDWLIRHNRVISVLLLVLIGALLLLKGAAGLRS